MGRGEGWAAGWVDESVWGRGDGAAWGEGLLGGMRGKPDACNGRGEEMCLFVCVGSFDFCHV